MISNYYLLPEFTPTRLQDLVLWFEPASLRGNTWYNLAPCYNRNHGTIFGGVSLSTWHPQFAPALEFHAEDDYVDLPLDVVFSDEMSIEIVFELYDDTERGRVIGSEHSLGNKYEMRSYTASTKHFLGISNGSATYYTYFFYNYKKVHGTWTWEYDEVNDETIFKAYKNGEFKNSITFSGRTTLPDQKLTLGRWRGLGMNGKIYMARFYHKVLSVDEIRHNYTHHPLYYMERGIDPYDFIKRKKFYFL